MSIVLIRILCILWTIIICNRSFLPHLAFQIATPIKFYSANTNNKHNFDINILSFVVKLLLHDWMLSQNVFHRNVSDISCSTKLSREAHDVWMNETKTMFTYGNEDRMSDVHVTADIELRSRFGFCCPLRCCLHWCGVSNMSVLITD